MLLGTIILAVLIIGGILLYRFEIAECTGAVVAATTGFVLFFWLLIWVLNYSLNCAGIQEFKAVQQTIDVSRGNAGSEYERVMLTEKIIEKNEWLAGCKFWNETFVGDQIPDEIMELEPIK
jgi:hypothetical protein